MDSINIHTTFGGDIYLRNYCQAGWEVEIYKPKDRLNYSERQLIVPERLFKTKSGAMSFIKRMIIKYANIMGEIND
jgi:hypothetical protein